MEFLSTARRLPDADLLATMATVGVGIGHFFERHLAEQAVRASKDRNAAILAAALDAIITIDHAGYVTEWNFAAERIFGYPAASALGQLLADLIIPPGLHAAHHRGIHHYLATGEGPLLGRRVEVQAIHADGTEFPVELSITRLPTDGPPVFTGFVRDLTVRKQAEEAVRFQAHLLDTVEQAVLATDVAGTIIYWNRCAETLYGWTATDVLGRNVLDVTPTSATLEQAAAILARLRAGESWSGEFEVQRRDGTTFPALVTNAPVCDAAGTVVAIVGVSLDITERKRAEEASHFLAEASAVLASSLDDVTVLHQLAQLAVPRLADWCAVDMIEADGAFRRLAVAHVDPAKVELAWELERRYGFDPTLPEGAARVLRSGQSVLYPEISDALLAAVTQDAEHLQLLQRVGLRSGMIVPLVARERTLGAISLGMAEAKRTVGPADRQLAEDLAHRAALAIDNARLYGEAQAAVRLREEFLSVAAHELRTPITSLLGYSQVVQRRAARNPALDERTRHALQVIEGQAERLSRLITSLLEVSRLATGHFHVHLEPLDLGALVRRIGEEVQPMLDGHTLELAYPQQPVMIAGDAARLEQVLQNLIQNAVKYSPGGGPISISLELRDTEAVLAVTDHGSGIPAAAVPHLFQRFFRAAHTAQAHTAGMGIGLYVVHEIVVQHGGAVEVTSEEGSGSTFTVRLPREAHNSSSMKG
jgi:PAS domain S-box-containing protein